jgi:hypothetical protein
MNLRSRERQIYLSRLNPTQRARIKAAEKAKEEGKKAKEAVVPLKENRFSRLLAEAGLVIEGLDVARAIVWLNQAYQTIIDRSEEITMLPEKQEYTQLATVIQAAIPVNNATPESVASNLNILRQQIQLKEDDSEMLRKLKGHLIKALSEVLANPQAGAPDANQAGAEGAPGGAPPAPGGGGAMGAPPPAGGAGAAHQGGGAGGPPL